MRRIYSKHEAAWAEKLARVRITDAGNPGVTTVKDAVILPIRKRELTDLQTGGVFDGLFEGGVATSGLKFVAGCMRDTTKGKRNYSCASSYRPKGRMARRDEDVVFGGVLYGHFGHMLTDGLSRMWWFARNQDSEMKLVFAMMPGESPENARRIFDLAGLPENRYSIVDEPTSFRSVLVPDEAVFTLEGRADRRWLEFFDLLVRNADSISTIGTHEKIYLTRTLCPRRDGINEEYYERFFSGEGYKVIAPEKLELADQVRLLSHAGSVACTMGTLSHLGLFMREGAALTCLLRSDSTVMQQLLINEARALDWMMFDAHLNLLPTTQWRGAYLYGPTEGFREYLEDRAIKYDASSQTQEEVLRKRAYEYLELWRAVYSDPASFKAVYKRNLVDVLDAIDSCASAERGDYRAFESYDAIKMRFYQKQNERRLVRRVKRVLRGAKRAFRTSASSCSQQRRERGI